MRPWHRKKRQRWRVRLTTWLRKATRSSDDEGGRGCYLPVTATCLPGGSPGDRGRGGCDRKTEAFKNWAVVQFGAT